MKAHRIVCSLLLFVVAAVLFVALSAGVSAFATEDDKSVSDGVDESLDGLDLSDLDEFCDEYIGSVVDKIRAIANGEFDSASDFLHMFAELFLSGATAIVPTLLSMFAVVVIVGLCRQTTDGLVGQGTSNAVSFVGVAVLSVSLLNLLRGAYAQVLAVVDKISVLSEAASPVMLTLLIANGAATLGAVCRPSMVVFSSVILAVVRSVVLPLSLFATLFVIAGNISDSIRVEKLSSFLGNTAGWILGVFFMLFSAFTSVQGIAAGSVDSVSIRAAKFAAKNYVPILGGYVSEGMDVVLAGGTLVKNSLGAVVLVVLVLAVVKPIVYVLAVGLGLQAVSAFAQPVAEPRVVKLLSGVGKNLTVLVAVIFATAFMFALQILIAMTCVNAVI